jgi:uncharacterized OB-fold protein
MSADAHRAAMDDVPDWTLGTPGIALQRCPRCRQAWYFRRDFCPGCGASPPDTVAAGGGGVVHAATVVHRAPDDAFRAVAPYCIVLVELDEGVRVMGHATMGLAIGDRVRVAFREIAGRLLPWFERPDASRG